MVGIRVIVKFRVRTICLLSPSRFALTFDHNHYTMMLNYKRLQCKW